MFYSSRYTSIDIIDKTVKYIFLIKEKGAEEGKTKVTNENGTLNLEGLYIEKI